MSDPKNTVSHCLDPHGSGRANDSWVVKPKIKHYYTVVSLGIRISYTVVHNASVRSSPEPNAFFSGHDLWPRNWVLRQPTPPLEIVNPTTRSRLSRFPAFLAMLISWVSWSSSSLRLLRSLRSFLSHPSNSTTTLCSVLKPRYPIPSHPILFLIQKKQDSSRSPAKVMATDNKCVAPPLLTIYASSKILPPLALSPSILGPRTSKSA